jgi:hypothetical protein
LKQNIAQNDTIIQQINGILNGFSANVKSSLKSDKLMYYNENTQLNDIIRSKRDLLFDQSKNRLKVINFQKTIKEIAVSSVINCGGPDTDLSRSVSGFPKICILKGMFRQDDLKLGIDVNPDTYEVIDRWNRPISNILAIGPLLKGVLWETTAIRELREQTEDVAKQLMVKMAEN